jgi:signal transduction histidine kinase
MMSDITHQIQVASNKIEAVIQRVLDFSKPNTPRMVPIDINSAIQSAIDLSAVTFRKSGIQIETDLSPKLPRIFGDSHLIEQVILNLLTNADRAMEDSTADKRVVIRTAHLNQTVMIKVSDTGPGIPLKIREKVFDPFFTTKPDGSGIGLSIVQRIIADHNGTIDIDSSPWAGAEFVIKLPIEKRMSPR